MKYIENLINLAIDFNALSYVRAISRWSNPYTWEQNKKT